MEACKGICVAHGKGIHDRHDKEGTMDACKGIVDGTVKRHMPCMQGQNASKAWHVALLRRGLTRRELGAPRHRIGWLASVTRRQHKS